MRVSLPHKMKPDSYTESCTVDAADRWRERNVWYPGEICAECSERNKHYREMVLSAQKSAEVIVAVFFSAKDRINRSL